MTIGNTFGRPAQAGLDSHTGRQPKPRRERWRLFAPLSVVAVALIIESIRLLGFVPPVPFLILFGAVVFSAAIGGFRGALIAAILADLYILYAALSGFGPVFLTASIMRALEGMIVFTGVGVLLGRLQDQNWRYRTQLEHQMNARYEALIRNAPEAIVVANVAGRILDFNPRAQLLLGLNADADVQPTVVALSPQLQADGRPSAETAAGYLKYALENGPITFDWLHQHTDGRIIPCEVSLSYLPDDREPLVRGLIRDISERKRNDALRNGEYAVLQSIARGDSLSKSLDQLARTIETYLPGALCTVMLLQDDGESVETLAAPSLSETYANALNGLKIGPNAGSCGTAMHFNRQVITEDIDTDPNWAPYLPLSQAENLHACWSTPIHDAALNVIGSFALYHRRPRRPSEAELRLIERLTDIAGIAIERYKRADDLRRNAQLYQATFEHAAVGIAHVEPDGRFRQVNPQFCDMLGYDEDELGRLTLRDITHPEDAAFDVQPLADLRSRNVDSYRAENRWLRKDGSLVWVKMSVGAIFRDNDELERLVVVAEDVSSAHQLSQTLSYQAKHDALTGLINREEFESRLSAFLRNVVAGEEQGAFCYLDLDQFKLVNDTAGHVAGDEMLRQVAPRLRNCIRGSDTLARLGGDEFGVLLMGCDEEHAITIAEEIRKSIEEFTFVWQEHSFKPGVSIGVVPLNSDVLTSTTDVLQAADTACYAAKDAGRNRYMVWHEDNDQLFRRRGEMQWIPRLIRAVDEDRLTLVAQPIVGLNGDLSHPTWYELLLRLNDDDDDMVPPGAFLPAAERYGLAPRLDRAVVEKALAWMAGQCPEIVLSINLSGQTFGDPAFREFLTQALTNLGSTAQRLCFEITETAAIGNLSDALALIETVRGFGCKIALDDFGSGLSSFAYLKNLPVDYLKIDGTFVRDIASDPIDLAIVQSIHDVGRVMNKLTIAEFVESEAVMNHLREIGVDYAQGYWTGRPVPIDQLARSSVVTDDPGPK